MRFAVLADLHGSIFGEENSALLKKIQENAPDAILLAGDMVVPDGSFHPGNCQKTALYTGEEFPHLFTPWETT